MALNFGTLHTYASEGVFAGVDSYASNGLFGGLVILITCWSLDLVSPPLATLSFTSSTNAALVFTSDQSASLSFQPNPVAVLTFQVVGDLCPLTPVVAPLLDFSLPENSQYLALFAYATIGGET